MDLGILSSGVNDTLPHVAFSLQVSCDLKSNTSKSGTSKRYEFWGLILTKPLDSKRFEYLQSVIGLCTV